MYPLLGVLGRSKAKSHRCLLRCFRLLVVVGALSSLGTALHAQDMHAAETDLLQGRADAALRELQSMLAQNPKNASAQLLLCRAQLSILHGDEAATACQAALNNGLGQNSAAQDWAGRAFGMRAQHAGPFTGMHLAGAVRQAFLAAHTLDPHSTAAANDLGEYYVSAPAIVGGGVDKALALATSIEATLPEVSHRLRALAAEKRNDTAGAEHEFVLATQVAQSPGAWVDLANFYIRRNAPDKAAGAAKRALALDTTIDATVVDAALALKDAHQPAPAIEALRRYLDHGSHSDAALVFRAHTELGQILQASGQKDAARHEYEAALALASGYAPARKGLASL